MGSGKDIIMISSNKHLTNNCFQPQYRRFRDSNWPDKKPVVIEADLPTRPQRPFDPLL